ncbi:MAG: InlB B-repeat-containing protein, partial [Clostridia bacterium]|nr:InlB B-repeat-containing protein [Clostridia bacterium]
MKKRILAVILSVLSLGTLTLAGCFKVKCSNDYLPEYVSGYFKYAVKTEKDGEKKAYLTGLTESGQEQTALVYPEELDGIPVYSIGYERSLFVSRPVGYFGSDNLEKIFFPTSLKESPVNDTINNLYKKTFAVYWDLDSTEERIYGVKGAIFGYNFLEADFWFKDYLPRFVANVSYLYNYDNSPNKDYYWVDSYDESVITFIPPEPEREGYEFGGWYKESECINEWDFETDITGKEIELGDKKPDKYDGLYL